MTNPQVKSARTAIVTGAGSGVGRTVALGMLDAGYNVVLAGRRAAALEETASLAKSGIALPVSTDVTDPGSVASLFVRAVQHFGRLDLLFNNAGRIAPALPPDELDIATWRSVVDTNLTGAFFCAREAFRTMRAQVPRGGRIINNGSVSAHTPRPNSTPYTATKHAITGLTKSLALDGRPFDIVCGQIDIGNAATPLNERMTVGVLQADLSMKPEPRMDARHVASAVLYMDSLPLDANVLFMTIMASQMPFVGRG